MSTFEEFSYDCGVGAAKRHNNGDKIDVIGSSIRDLMSENDWGCTFQKRVPFI